MKSKRTIVYWIESTNLIANDELIQLTIADDNGNILFNHMFKPNNSNYYWCNHEKKKLPASYLNAKPFIDYLNEIQDIFNSANILVGFSNHATDDRTLKQAGIKLPDVLSYDVMEMFAVIDNPCIEHCAEFYGYRWQHDKLHRTSVDYVKAVTHCYQQMQRYRKAQEN